ncbi:hypothetical protein CTAYLR_009800 [Chrysophaeum taylorii]|uniref:AMP-dependent synthetase/ligase domain-containing protein n=1 Tax=Chrysophaeum taylorii TaxID=2483200 RepID=A0AAD7UNZ9_9STRA|nr:hypothetical protein CTAYLR_009800 [Chrysophaeum taylorii]
MTSSKPLWWRPWSDEPSWHAQARKTATVLDKEMFLTWLDSDGAEAVNLSFHDVWSRSAFVATWLHENVGLAPGDRAMLVYAPGPEFFVAFVACLRAGVLAVPNYPPDPANLRRGLEKLGLVGANCGAGVGLTDSVVHKLRATTSVRHAWPKISWHNTDGLGGSDNPSSLYRLTLDVRLGEAAKSGPLLDLHDPSERVAAVSWLPQFHDTGLILMLLGPFCAGYHMINFSPLSFLADPLMWMRAVSKYRALWTAAPDFGYQLCAKRAAMRAESVHDIDLSCVVYLVGGAGQRCVPSILLEFAAYFVAHCKLPDDGSGGIFIPNYGLAEHVVATCGEVGGLITSRRRKDLVSCGSDFQIDLCIVNAETRRVVPNGTPGELWLSSGSVANGYWGKPELSRETFRAQLDPDDGKVYLRTGDEAFIEDGHLFVCGRIKDLIIIGGENYYSDDVEIAATEAMADAVRPGCVAAFSVVGADDDNERLCIVLEIRDTAVTECNTLASTLTTSVHLGLSSQEALDMQSKLWRDLSVEVQFNVIVDPNLSIAQLADKILCIALGEDESSPLAPLAPLADGIDLGSMRLAEWVVDVVQALSLILVVVLVSIALIPSYHFGHWVQWHVKSIESKRIEVRRDNAPWSHIEVAGTDHVDTYGILLPLVIPLFMLSLATLIILAKWLVIGRYRVGTTLRGTPFFLRWWVVDRLIDQFDLWVGMFIYDTLFINCFYVLMGTEVSLRARIKVLLREFDLVSVGSHATVSGAVFARMFELNGVMRFARTIFEPRSETKSQSVVMPGCKIEVGAVLDHGAATMAGMQLAAGGVYQSSPAQPSGSTNVPISSPSTSSWLCFEMAKLATLPCFLYGSFFASNVIIAFASRRVDWYAWQFRYRELAYFVLGYYAAMFV